MIGGVVEMLFLGIGIPALLATVILFATLRRTWRPNRNLNPQSRHPVFERGRTDER